MFKKQGLCEIYSHYMTFALIREVNFGVNIPGNLGLVTQMSA